MKLNLAVPCGIVIFLSLGAMMRWAGETLFVDASQDSVEIVEPARIALKPEAVTDPEAANVTQLIQAVANVHHNDQGLFRLIQVLSWRIDRLDAEVGRLSRNELALRDLLNQKCFELYQVRNETCVLDGNCADSNVRAFKKAFVTSRPEDDVELWGWGKTITKSRGGAEHAE